MSLTNPKASLIVGIAIALASAAATANAQELTAGVSCLDGQVGANDYAEFVAGYRESIWDNKAAVRIVARDAPLEITVTDTNGESVCEDTADMKTRCKFKISSNSSGTFVVRIDNLVFNGNSRYRLCAE